MHKPIDAPRVSLFLVVVLSLMLAGCGAVNQEAGAGDAAGRPFESISVSGFGQATGRPDIATIQFGVEVESDSVTEGVDLSSQTVDRVRAAIFGMGIAETDVQSTSFNVWVEDRFDRLTGELTGERIYHVDSTLTVKVRDLSKISDVIQTALDAGANNVFGLTFGIDNAAALQAEARKEALADAKARADQLAAELGVTVGEAVGVSELSGGSLLAGIEAAFALARPMGGGGGIPLEPGELTVTIQVDVMYALER